MAITNLKNCHLVFYVRCGVHSRYGHNGQTEYSPENHRNTDDDSINTPYESYDIGGHRCADNDINNDNDNDSINQLGYVVLIYNNKR